MTESGFPAIAEHRDEHQRILGELEQFRKRVDMGWWR
jgi:hemerythrin